MLKFQYDIQEEDLPYIFPKSNLLGFEYQANTLIPSILYDIIPKETNNIVACIVDHEVVDIHKDAKKPRNIMSHVIVITKLPATDLYQMDMYIQQSWAAFALDRNIYQKLIQIRTNNFLPYSSNGKNNNYKTIKLAIQDILASMRPNGETMASFISEIIMRHYNPLQLIPDELITKLYNLL